MAAKGLNSKTMYSILQGHFFFTNKSSACACLHNVATPEIQSKWILFTLSYSAYQKLAEQDRNTKLYIKYIHTHIYTRIIH